MSAFESELKIFEQEALAAQQYFYAYLSLRVSDEADDRLKALNVTPLLWLTVENALLTSTVVTLGRIFDGTSDHHIGILMKSVRGNWHLFSKAEMAKRKGAAYAEGIDDFDVSALKAIERAVKEARKTFSGPYRDLRNKVYAHREITDEQALQDIFDRTDIAEIQGLLALLERIHDAIWQAFHNGRRLDLGAPELPSLKEASPGVGRPGSRVYAQSLKAQSMLVRAMSLSK
jgi:hypothetical protein